MDDNRNPPHTSSDVDVQQSSPDHASTSNPNNLTSTNTDINNNKKKNKKPTAVVQKVPFYKLFVFADKFDFTLMAVGSIAAVCNGLTQPLMTLLFGQVINSFGSSDSEHVVHQVSKVSLKFFYLAFYACIVCFLQVSCWMVTGERQAARIRSLYLKAILRQDVAFFDTETTTGEVIGRLSGDTVLIQNAMGEKVGKFIQLMATFVGGFAIAFIQGWHLAIVLLSSIPALVVIGATMGLIMTKMSSRAQTTYAEAGNVVEQTIGAIRTVASFTGETEAITKYNTKLNVAYRSTVQQGLASGLGLGALLTIIFSTYSLAVWYGGKLIINGEYNGGQVINVIIAMLAGGTSLGQTSPSLNAFAAGQAAAYKMFETIKRKPKIDTSSMEGTELAEVKGEIELRNVYFRYPARSDLEIFSGFSLHIPNGITVALVGQSGSGKSTVISLIERFYDPDAGEVLIDGINLKALKLSWFRQKVGLVSQEPNLFTTTIRENIKYGKEEATEEEILAAMERANASKFIDKLPLGLDTMVGEHGTQLSGGQKQRIAIARAILKNPKILLLDEATSALDVESEHIVQEALDRIMADRTTVVVAHRLTTIKDADIIAVVRQGKIIEQGTHNELIQNASSVYSQLVQLQEGDKDHEPTPIDSADLVNVSTSMRRSMSIGSSSGRRSLSINFGIPGSVFIHETNEDEHEINDDNGENTSNNKKSYESSNMKRKKVSLARLFTLNKPEVPILLLGTAAASVHGVIFPISGLLLSTTIKIFYEPLEYLSKDSRFWALVYLCLAASCLAAIPGQNFFFGIAGGRLVRRVRLLTFQKLVHQEIGWFDDPKHSSGAIGARLSTDASNVRGLVGDQLALVVQNVATVTAGLVIAFTANYILALIVLAVAPFMLLQGYFQARFMMGFSADAKVMYEEASQIANDAVGSIRTIISYCAEKKVMNLYDAKCEEPVKHVVRLAFVSGAGIGFSLFALYCTNAFCFYIGAVLIHHNKASFGEFFKVFFAVTITARGLSESSSLAIDRNRAKDSTASIFDILDRKSMIDSSNDEGITLTNVEGDVVLEHVSFKYPTRPDIQIFKDLCLNIPSGKTVALVGESGSGKSTIISLIERFYDPIEGKVLLDRVEINKLKISWLRRQMGLVSQEPILFNDTIRANIGYGRQGKETVLEEEIIRAAKSSNAHNFISSLPEGYDTNVGERGNQLSGGQKQRIAIARAILRDPKILLLDEATSALDAESEQVVQEALDQVMVNRTTVMVAHRLSTVRNADVIAVVKNGVVAEQGKHDELMVIPEGAYASLVALQSRAAVDDVDGHK